MGKGGAVLGLIGILIGAGGLIFGFIAWNSVNAIQANQTTNEAWYSENDGPFDVAPTFTVIELSILNITFELDSIASVYLSFACRASITATTGYSSVFFFFKVDDVRIDHPSSRVGSFFGTSTEDYYSVNLQHFIENMAAGSHNVTMEVSTEYLGNELTNMSLFVESYSS